MIFPSSHRSAHLLSCLPYFEKPQGSNDYRYTVSIHADMLKIKRLDSPRTNKKIVRGQITGFSAKSRKRMIELLASIREAPDLFCTMTYSDDCATMSPEIFRPHFEAFRRRLEYYYKDIKIIWRLELEDRKSGTKFGQILPHFHLLIWLPEMSDTQKQAILFNSGEIWRVMWHEIIKSTSEAHLRQYGLQLAPIKSRKHAYSYASKYVAKVDNDQLSIGRRWGRIGKFDTGPLLEIEINEREYVQFKRLVTSYLSKRTKVIKVDGKPVTKYVGKHIAKRIKRRSVALGLTAFGLGAWNDKFHGLQGATVFNMLLHAKMLVDSSN